MEPLGTTYRAGSSQSAAAVLAPALAALQIKLDRAYNDVVAVRVSCAACEGMV